MQKMFNQDRKNAPQNMDAFVEERLSDYLDGNLSDRERAMVEAHLAVSERARGSLESLRYTVNLLKQTPAPALPRQFTLPVTLRAPAQRTSGWLVWSLRGVAVAATAAFVVLLTAIALRPPTANQTASAPAPAPAVVVAALRPTETALPIVAQVPANDNASPEPLMITVEPPPATEIAPAPVPITETPAVQQKSAVVLAAPTTADQLPTATPPKTAASESAEVMPTETVAKPMVNAAGANPKVETPPVPATAAADAATASTASHLSFVEGTILIDDLSVRRGPDIAFRPVGILKIGDKVNVVGRSTDAMWLVIEYPKNTETGLGWIGSSYVQMNKAIDLLPVVEPPGPGKPQIKPTLEGLPTVTPAP